MRKLKSEYDKKYYESKKTDPVFLKKKRERAMEYRRINKEKISEQNKKKCSSDEYKSKRRVYYKSNRDVILTKNKERNKEYSSKISTEVSVCYVKNVILVHSGGLIKREDITPKLIELKRKQIQSWRKLQALKNSSPVHQK